MSLYCETLGIKCSNGGCCRTCEDGISTAESALNNYRAGSGETLGSIQFLYSDSPNTAIAAREVVKNGDTKYIHASVIRGKLSKNF